MLRVCVHTLNELEFSGLVFGNVWIRKMKLGIDEGYFSSFLGNGG